MTARPGKVKPEVKPAGEDIERALRASVNLTELLTKLAHRLVNEDEPLQAGIVASSVNHVRQVSAYLDSLGAKHNDRLRKDGLHGVREDTERQTDSFKQVQLL